MPERDDNETLEEMQARTTLHIQQAQELIDKAKPWIAGQADRMIAAAQVQATLALVRTLQEILDHLELGVTDIRNNDL